MPPDWMSPWFLANAKPLRPNSRCGLSSSGSASTSREIHARVSRVGYYTTQEAAPSGGRGRAVGRGRPRRRSSQGRRSAVPRAEAQPRPSASPDALSPWGHQRGVCRPLRSRPPPSPAPVRPHGSARSGSATPPRVRLGRGPGQGQPSARQRRNRGQVRRIVRRPQLKLACLAWDRKGVQVRPCPFPSFASKRTHAVYGRAHPAPVGGVCSAIRASSCSGSASASTMLRKRGWMKPSATTWSRNVISGA